MPSISDVETSEPEGVPDEAVVLSPPFEDEVVDLVPSVVFSVVVEAVVFSGLSPQETANARTNTTIATARRRDKILFIVTPFFAVKDYILSVYSNRYYNIKYRKVNNNVFVQMTKNVGRLLTTLDN